MNNLFLWFVFGILFTLSMLYLGEGQILGQFYNRGYDKAVEDIFEYDYYYDKDGLRHEIEVIDDGDDGSNE